MDGLILNCSVPGLSLSASGKALGLCAAMPESIRLPQSLQSLPLQASLATINLIMALAPVTVPFITRLNDHEFLTADGEILTADGEALWS